MSKKDCLSLFLILILSFLYIILLNDYYKIGLDSLMVMFGVLPIIVGIKNSFHYVNLGIGMTRKQISSKYIIELIYVILLGIVYLALISICASFVYNTVYIPFHNIVLETIFVYSLMLFISSIAMFICNMLYSYKNAFLYLLLSIIVISLGLLYIYLYKNLMFIIGIIISIVLFIALVFVNKKILMNKKM